MYDELIKRLRECTAEQNGEKTLWHQAADAIEELTDRNVGKWIPVTERLPKCEWGAEVGNIVWISHGIVRAGCFGRWGKYRDAYFRTWTDAGEGMDAKDADYWRAVTLPEPPMCGLWCGGSGNR